MQEGAVGRHLRGEAASWVVERLGTGLSPLEGPLEGRATCLLRRHSLRQRAARGSILHATPCCVPGAFPPILCSQFWKQDSSQAAMPHFAL